MWGKEKKLVIHMEERTLAKEEKSQRVYIQSPKLKHQITCQNNQKLNTPVFGLLVRHQHTAISLFE